MKTLIACIVAMAISLMAVAAQVAAHAPARGGLPNMGFTAALTPLR